MVFSLTFHFKFLLFYSATFVCYALSVWCLVLDVFFYRYFIAWKRVKEGSGGGITIRVRFLNLVVTGQWRSKLFCQPFFLFHAWWKGIVQIIGGIYSGGSFVALFCAFQ